MRDDRLVRSVLWRGFDPPGHERCDLLRDGPGWRLAGTVVAALEGQPATVRYDVALDGDWATSEARIDLRIGAALRRSLRLTVDPAGRWWAERDGEGESVPVAFADGLVDVDLGCTPATNTLPIRRLRPGVGAAVDYAALWVRFPDLALEPLSQRYGRLDPRRYRYEAEGGFVAGIEVDDLGLVVDYEGLWRREAVASAEP